MAEETKEQALALESSGDGSKAVAAKEADIEAIQKVAGQSVQKRFEPQDVPDSSGFFAWFVSTAASEVSDWWSEQRDIDLSSFWMRQGNDILQGAISSLVKKFRAMNWALDGPEAEGESKPQPGTIEFHQNVLAEAEAGDGWDELLSQTLIDYFVRDKGAFWELIGIGEPDKPLSGPVTGLAHLDSGRCHLTGDIVYPVLYDSPKSGKKHKLHASRVVHFVDMRSPNEEMLGVGFCAVSRVIASSQVLLKLAQYKNEKLDDLPEAGLLLLNNLTPKAWMDAKANYQRERRRLGQELWSSIMVLQGVDPAQPVSADFISFANLPDAFDEASSTNIYVNILALAFGVDVREFWPMTGGALGTATESLVMHQKAKGKGVGEIISLVERAVNWKVLPRGVTFGFDFRDDEEDEQAANITRTREQTILDMWRPPTPDQLQAGILPPVTREEIRQMLADNVPYFKEDFLAVDVSREGEVTDTERDKAYSRRRGRIDKKGRYGPVGTRLSRAQVDDALSIAEKNFRAGRISAEQVAEFALAELRERQ